MNRAEMTRRVLLLEAAARQCKEQAKELRDELETDALSELEREGTQPTWKLRDVGTWTLPVSSQEVYVSNEAAVLAWVKETHDGADEFIETTERLKGWYVADLLRLTARVVEGQVVDEDGEVIPGLDFRVGGVPKTLQFRPASDAKAVADQVADKVVRQLAAAFGMEADPDAPEPAAP